MSWFKGEKDKEKKEWAPIPPQYIISKGEYERQRQELMRGVNPGPDTLARGQSYFYELYTESLRKDGLLKDGNKPDPNTAFRRKKEREV